MVENIDLKKELDELLILAGLKNSPKIYLPTDKNGNVFIDKEQHPDLYDWTVNC
ncbi:MAG: hypothetical protein LBM93_08950 [Oscillospiraceae bacterium]|jgi:hypothetical protein|nr:hypothetical protein [Oscillospiraceae bacterium]